MQPLKITQADTRNREEEINDSETTPPEETTYQENLNSIFSQQG
jgi:hypothetical protein